VTPIFSEDAARVLDQLEKDPETYCLFDATWDCIDLIVDQPASAAVRRRLLRTPGGHSVWMVPIPVHHNDDRWVVLWQPQGDDVYIPYIGPEDFHPSM
jgi:hypothetical protein